MKRLMLLISIIAVLTSCSTRNRNVEDGDIIDLHVGEIVTIELEENPTTGYSWVCTFSEDSTVVLVDDRYIAEKSKGMVGAGGVHRYCIKGIDEGDSIIRFSYRRPWEKDVQSVEEKNIIFHVTRKRLNISIGLQASHTF